MNSYSRSISMISSLLSMVLLSIGFGSSALAQGDVGSWPTQRPIKLIAVFPPGGSVGWSQVSKAGAA